MTPNDHRPKSRRTERRARTKRLTVCAMLTALGVTLSWLGSLVSVLDMCTALFTALLLVPVVIEYGKGYPWGVWLATTVLALLLLPNKTPAAVYLAFGYYPIVKARLERLPTLVMRLLKLLVFIAVDAVLVITSCYLLGVQEQMPVWYPAALAALGLLTLGLTDLALTRLITVYLYKYRARVSKWMH